MTVTKSKYGAVVITDIIDNVLVTRKYFGFSVNHAKKMFKKFYKPNKRKDI